MFNPNLDGSFAFLYLFQTNPPAAPNIAPKINPLNPKNLPPIIPPAIAPFIASFDTLSKGVPFLRLDIESSISSIIPA